MLIAIFLILFALANAIGLIGNTIECIKEKTFFRLIGLGTIFIMFIVFSMMTVAEIFAEIF